MRGNPTTGEQKRSRNGRVVADCLHEKILSACVCREHGEIHLLKSYDHLQYGHVRDLTTNAIAHDTMYFRTVSQKAVPVEPLGKEFTFQYHGLDKYKRAFGEVILPDGMNLNQELVKQGWCWWCRKYAPGNRGLERARADRTSSDEGLWADPQPVPPWEWRKRNEC